MAWGPDTAHPEGIMATIEKALQIAAKAHEGQVDKEGLPYILHPLGVMAGAQRGQRPRSWRSSTT